mmetsp:Transcript_35853/g.43822  ORF Transcript_35853/g.43822 Transcript_35853/m.43822 type:complete len:108 (+) Transcript_35853:66-389(+)
MQKRNKAKLLEHIAAAKFSGRSKSPAVAAAEAIEEVKQAPKARARRAAAKPIKIEYESDAPSETASDEKPAVTKKSLVAPKNWLAVWQGIEAMRQENVAAVDSMGCD